MNEDIKSIGYGVKAGNNYVSGEDKDFSFFPVFQERDICFQKDSKTIFRT